MVLQARMEPALQVAHDVMDFMDRSAWMDGYRQISMDSCNSCCVVSLRCRFVFRDRGDRM
jgi:hypothetical protein